VLANRQHSTFYAGKPAAVVVYANLALEYEADIGSESNDNESTQHSGSSQACGANATEKLWARAWQATW
jgi:hypothetical protein